MAESQEKSDMNTILFTNLQLLGLDVVGMEASYKIPFNKDMFNLPNKAGSEAVLYFLFERLNPSLCKEQFRDCWPVLDRKQELHFRKVCTNWLTTIQKEDGESRLPRVNAALLLSPGGGKFIYLLYSFSTHVLVNVMKSEHGWKAQDSIVYPILQPRTTALGSVMESAIHDSLIREKNQFFENLYQTIDANRQWKDYANELVKDFRSLNKSNRHLEHEKRQQVNILAENCLKQGIMLPAKRTVTMFDSDQDSSAIARGQRLQKIQSQWNSLMEFNDRVTEASEIFHSILENETSGCVLDGTEIGVRVPGLLLRERSEEIHKRGIDNVYSGGALNLVSLVQLWNISLNMYKDQLKSETLPSVSSEVPQLRAQAHEHQSHLRQIQELRDRLKNHTLPKLRNSIAQLQKQLNNQCTLAASMDKDGNLGLSLTAPTPPLSAVTRNSVQVQASPAAMVAGFSADTGSTPDALQDVTGKIETAVQRRVEASGGLKGAPSLARLKSSQTRSINGRNVPSHIPKSQLKKDTMKSVKSQYNTKISSSKKSVDFRLQESTSVGSTTSHETMHAYKNQGNTVAISTSSTTPRSSKRNAMDILADNIVDSVLNSSDSALLSDVSVDTLLEFGDFGVGAFQTKNLIGRSPVKDSTSFQDAESMQTSPGAIPAVLSVWQKNKESFNNQEMNPSLSHESVVSLDGKDEDNSCDSLSEVFDWSNNASKDALSWLQKGYIPSSGMQKNTGMAESASILSGTGDLLKTVSEADKSSSAQFMNCVFSHSERTPKQTRLNKWGEITTSRSPTFDQCVVNCWDATDKPTATHTDNDELQIPHSVNSLVKEGRNAVESSTTLIGKDDVAAVHLQFPKTLKHAVQHSPSPKIKDYQNSRNATPNLTKIKSLCVNKKGFNIQGMPDRLPGDGQDNWDETVQQVPMRISGWDSDAEAEESDENRRDSGAETEESADLSGLRRLAPISTELESLAASDILTATECNILENSHDEEIPSVENHNVQLTDSRNSLTTKIKLQFDTESQSVLNSCKNSHNQQTPHNISSDSLFEDRLQLEDFDAKAEPNLITFDSEEEPALSDSYIPYKQGICWDSKSPLKQNLTPLKAQPSAKDDLRPPSDVDVPSSSVSSSDSIQTKLAQLQQKVLDILGSSLDDIDDVEEQPQPYSDKNETTAAIRISPDDDDDILSTDLLNTDLLGGLDDLI